MGERFFLGVSHFEAPDELDRPDDVFLSLLKTVQLPPTWRLSSFLWRYCLLTLRVELVERRCAHVIRQGLHALIVLLPHRWLRLVELRIFTQVSLVDTWLIWSL